VGRLSPASDCLEVGRCAAPGWSPSTTSIIRLSNPTQLFLPTPSNPTNILDRTTRISRHQRPIRLLHTLAQQQLPNAHQPASATHPPPAMLNLRSALVAATLAVSALAAPQLTVPATIPVTAATQIEVTWKDDGKAPTIAQLKSFTLQLFVGGNTAEDSVGRIE
jgi:hypothetical protein